MTEPSEHAGFVNALPMIHNRWMPSIESDGSDSLDELVTMSGFDAEVGRTYAGELRDRPVRLAGRGADPPPPAPN